MNFWGGRLGIFLYSPRAAAPSTKAIGAHSFWIPCAAGARGGVGHGGSGGAAPARAGCGRRGRCRGRGRPAPRGGNPSQPHRGGPRQSGGRGAHGPAPAAGRALSHVGTRPGSCPFPPTPAPTDRAIFRAAAVTDTGRVRRRSRAGRLTWRVPPPHPRGDPPASRPLMPAGGPPASRPLTPAGTLYPAPSSPRGPSRIPPPRLPRSAPLPAAPRLRRRLAPPLCPAAALTPALRRAPQELAAVGVVDELPPLGHALAEGLLRFLSHGEARGGCVALLRWQSLPGKESGSQRSLPTAK